MECLGQILTSSILSSVRSFFCFITVSLHFCNVIICETASSVATVTVTFFAFFVFNLIFGPEAFELSYFRLPTSAWSVISGLFPEYHLPFPGFVPGEKKLLIFFFKLSKVTSFVKKNLKAFCGWPSPLQEASVRLGFVSLKHPVLGLFLNGVMFQRSFTGVIVLPPMGYPSFTVFQPSQLPCHFRMLH